MTDEQIVDRLFEQFCDMYDPTTNKRLLRDFAWVLVRSAPPESKNRRGRPTKTMRQLSVRRRVQRYKQAQALIALYESPEESLHSLSKKARLEMTEAEMRVHQLQQSLEQCKLWRDAGLVEQREQFKSIEMFLQAQLAEARAELD